MKEDLGERCARHKNSFCTDKIFYASKNKTEHKIFSCVQMSRICFRLSNLKRTIFSYVFISLKHAVTFLSTTTVAKIEARVN